MFVPNDQHLQMPMFSSINSLPEKLQNRLEESWAGVFYREVFVRLDESRFAELYSDEPSRPNIPVNVLAGLEILKAGFGWSDEEMYDHFCYDVQVRYALGYRDLSEGHFELRTMYNFRKRVTKHMQETGENLFEQIFEQITDEQIAAFKLNTDKLRMDSTMIASNIRETTRVQLLVEVLQRTHRMLDETDRQRYAKEFEPYLKGSSGQYIYHLKGEDIDEHLRRIGELMHRLVGELVSRYGEESTYRVLQRVFQEHFVVDESTLRPREGQELSASSMQSPDDWEATYRQKRGEKHRGYVTNVTETCNPENDFQLIVKVQTEPNNTDDAAMLDEALPGLKERTDVKQMYNDGGYNSPKVDETMREQRVEQIQSAIRGRKPSEEKLGLEDFDWETNDDGQPQTVTCPHEQSVTVESGRKDDRYRASFDASDCETCPFCDQCPTHPLERTPARVLRFSQQELDLALRRQRSADARASGQNLRAAVEATVRSVKHPFGNGKVPVRGQPRVSMVVVGSATMSNVRQIHRYKVAQRESEKAEKTNKKEPRCDQQVPAASLFSSFLAQLRSFLRSLNIFQPDLAYGF
ncbi:MAG: hypothetical protein DRN91_07650 [Candidatus Alkanophagales archaeon]|nr:MAG: hypothetical protein DRN91_07650 [Candidatus Alkanophagales archaeon]